MDKYALYLRKSRTDIEAEALGEGETLARHRNILLKLAEKNEIRPEQITVYQEIVSGESINERPEMQRLLKDVFKNIYKGVLVVEVERLARGNTKDQGTVAEAFKYSNTLIITPVKTYNPNNEFDEEYFEFGLFMSRREYKTIKRRMEAGRIESVKEGNYVGSLPPYGYDVVRKNKKERTLVKNNESKYVVMIYDWFVNDRMSCGAIARRLTQMGVPTKTGRPEWSTATIKEILKNDLYYGYVRWFRRDCTKKFDGEKLAKTKTRRTRKDYLLAKGKHPALISKETFDIAQTRFTGSVPVNANTLIVNPLAGLLVCKKCGHAMANQKYNGRPTTAPRYVHIQSQKCKAKSAPEKDVINLVISGLNEYIADFEIKLNNENLTRESDKHKEMIEGMEKELSKRENKRRRLFDNFEDGIYTKDEFIERKQIINSEIEKLKKQIEIERNNAPEKIDYKEKIVTFKKVVDALKDESIDAKVKNDMLKDIIKKINYECEDLGKGKGGIVRLEIVLK